MALSDEVRIRLYRDIRAVLVTVLALNWLVAGAKIAFGLLAGFNAMVADGFHSLSDGTSNIVGLVGIFISFRPADPSHPYGRRKYETLFSLAIAALLFLISANLFTQGVRKLSHPGAPDISAVTFIVMLVTLAVNFLVMRYEYRRGRELGSDILVADSRHTKADIFTSLSVILALALAKLGFTAVDPVMTMVIALFIAHEGYEILQENAGVLCDRAVIVDLDRVSAIVLKVDNVRGCHRVRTRGREDDIHIDLHVAVDPEMRVREAHAISDTIAELLKKELTGVTDVVVHVEPETPTAL